MYTFYVTIGHHFTGNYDVIIPTNQKMDLFQAIDACIGHFAQIYPNMQAKIQFISLTVILKK